MREGNQTQQPLRLEKLMTTRRLKRKTDEKFVLAPQAVQSLLQKPFGHFITSLPLACFLQNSLSQPKQRLHALRRNNRHSTLFLDPENLYAAMFFSQACCRTHEHTHTCGSNHSGTANLSLAGRAPTFRFTDAIISFPALVTTPSNPESLFHSKLFPESPRSDVARTPSGIWSLPPDHRHNREVEATAKSEPDGLNDTARICSPGFGSGRRDSTFGQPYTKYMVLCAAADCVASTLCLPSGSAMHPQPASLRRDEGITQIVRSPRVRAGLRGLCTHKILHEISIFVRSEGTQCDMSSTKATAKADIPDIHAESVQELREAFDLFDIKGAGEWG